MHYSHEFVLIRWHTDTWVQLFESKYIGIACAELWQRVYLCLIQTNEMLDVI